MSQTQRFLRIAQLTPLTYVNGPGARAMIHVQGCTLHCPGCWNPALQATQGGHSMRLASLLAWLAELSPRRGITLSGGEPLQQAEALSALLGVLRCTQPYWDVLLFTGYGEDEWSESMRRVVSLCDCVVAGRFVKELQHSASGLVSSINQRVHFPRGRITPEEVQERAYELSGSASLGFNLTGYPGPIELALVQSFFIQRPTNSQAHCIRPTSHACQRNMESSDQGLVVAMKIIKPHKGWFIPVREMIHNHESADTEFCANSDLTLAVKWEQQ